MHTIRCALSKHKKCKCECKGKEHGILRKEHENEDNRGTYGTNLVQ
jgi:hypothetical protein